METVCVVAFDHEIKLACGFIESIIIGKKLFEVRKDDRQYEVGNRIKMKEWDNTNKVFTGKWVIVEILFILRGEEGVMYGLQEGYCCWSHKVTNHHLITDEPIPVMNLEEEKTNAVKRCQSFGELEEVIRKHAPFISNSRETPVEWDADKLIRRTLLVIDGNLPSNITRANGLREKVIELCKKLNPNYYQYL